MQCKTCGLRFPPNDMAYSKHLDWHFRMQKRKVASQKSSAKSRSWFLVLENWLISNVIEDEKSTNPDEEKKEETEEIPKETDQIQTMDDYIMAYCPDGFED